jgi:hypothetical protein
MFVKIDAMGQNRYIVQLCKKEETSNGKFNYQKWDTHGYSIVHKQQSWDATLF